MDCRRSAVDDVRSRRTRAVDEDRHRRRWVIDADRRRRRREIDDYPPLELPLQWRDPPPEYPPQELPLKWRNPFPDHLVRNPDPLIPDFNSHRRRRDADRAQRRETLRLAQVEASIDRIDALCVNVLQSVDRIMSRPATIPSPSLIRSTNTQAQSNLIPPAYSPANNHSGADSLSTPLNLALVPTVRADLQPDADSDSNAEFPGGSNGAIATLLIPTFLRRHFNRILMGFFLHNPFPSSEIYRTLPVNEETLKAFLNCDLVVFHTFNYARHFISCYSRMLGIEYQSRCGEKVGCSDSVEQRDSLTPSRKPTPDRQRSTTGDTAAGSSTNRQQRFDRYQWPQDISSESDLILASPSHPAMSSPALLHAVFQPHISTSVHSPTTFKSGKLSYFGLAKMGPSGEETHVSTRVMGTQGYTTPEYVMTGHLTTKNDAYSFGVVLLEFLTGRRSVDKSRPKKEEKLVEWSEPYLSNSRKLHCIMDPDADHGDGETKLNENYNVGDVNDFTAGVEIPGLNLADKVDHRQCSSAVRHNVKVGNLNEAKTKLLEMLGKNNTWNPSLAAALGSNQPNPNLKPLESFKLYGCCTWLLHLNEAMASELEGPDRIFVRPPYDFTKVQVRGLLESFGALRLFDWEAFTGNYNDYFGLATDEDVIVYVMLVNDVSHGLYTEAINMGEDVCGMPTVLQSIRACRDWITHKFATDALIVVAPYSGQVISNGNSTLFEPLKACSFDKVKPVRGGLIKVLPVWRRNSDKGDTTVLEASMERKVAHFGNNENKIFDPGISLLQLLCQ